MRHGMLLLLLAGLIVIDTFPSQRAHAQNNKKVLVRVDGKSITQDDLERLYQFRNVSRELQPKVQDEFIDILIDTELMQQFLKSQKVTVSNDELAQQVKMVKGLLPPNAVAGAFAEQVLREELALPLKWRNYVLKTVTEQQIGDYFTTHHLKFDGTELRASQIFLAVESMSDQKQVEAGLAKLARIRMEIEAGLPFADAAKKYSDSPSGAKGGDLGWFLYEGKVSPQMAKMAFSLQKGELSQPFPGAKGVHLCLVTDRKEGESGLEDARTAVLQALSSELWTRKIKELRSKAKIDR